MISKPQLGVCTWTFGDLQLAEIAQRLVDLQFDGVELLGDLSRYSATEAKQILDDHGLSIFSLSPDNVDLAHPNTAVRQAAIDYYLKLLDFSAECGTPLVVCRGFVGRVRAISSLPEERALLVTAVRSIAAQAKDRGVHLVFEVINRYETHLIHTCTEAAQFIEDVNANNLGILLDAYHMNIEEQDAGGAIRQAGEQLWLYHIADSNRQGIGRGHTKLGLHLWGLEDIGYAGPLIFECMAPGSDPFTPIKGKDSLTWLETYLRESRSWF
ncbi:MAG: sugar phosphate isomerase/epimerase [Chloroflexi bacterium]|nr:sugar phosphate isomerase/epimerase [Chloroflexota bacterium]